MRFRFFYRVGRWISVLGAGMMLVSCATLSSVPVEVRKARPANPHLYDWYGDGVEGPVKVLISLGNQKAYFSKNGRSVGWSYVATGLPGHSTPSGNFLISEKVVDKTSNRYGTIINSEGNVIYSDAVNGETRVPQGARFAGARMPYWMRLTDYGVGMHAGDIPSPGRPASHGCIRMPLAMARILHENVRVGTLVEIER